MHLQIGSSRKGKEKMSIRTATETPPASREQAAPTGEPGARKRIFSGIQPTGSLHLGNYLGAVQNWVRLQDSYDCIICIVDLHALTIEYDPRAYQQRVQDMAVDLMACGIDPARCILFVQSHVPEHTEL